jgi:putative ABC transport system permease protein
VEIVGVVRDSAYLSLGESPRFMVYLCLRQSYSPAVTLYVRTHGDPEVALSGVRRAVQALDSRLVLSEPETMPQVIHESLWAPRLGAILFAAFGALAGALTIVGLYGVISYSVGQRTRELGIRMALGARPQDVLRQVLGEGAIMIVCGIFVGLAATLTITGIMSTLLFGVSAHDPLTLGCVVLVLLTPALAACLVPALRATRIDPILALRDE